MKIFIGADHKGFELKNKLKDWLFTEFEVEDVGAFEYDKTDDYVEFSERVAKEVAKSRDALGIVICGSGVGVDVVANKIPGIRCGLGFDEDQIESARRDDDINVLALSSDETDFQEAKKLIEVFLKTEFDGLARHQRRIDKIQEIEEENEE